VDKLEQADPVNILVGDRRTLLQLLDDAVAELKEGVGLGQEPDFDAQLREASMVGGAPF
jgi:hypothetical protein